MKKPLGQAPLWLQRMMLQLQPYNVNIIYTPGKQVVIADALSRAVENANGVNDEMTEELELYVHTFNKHLLVSEGKRKAF